MREAGLIPPDVDLVPTMSLTDLGCIFELLTGTCEKIHYLIRRAELETNMKYLGDEMDLLAFYLDTGFNIDEIEFASEHWMFLFGMSDKLAPYFMRQWTGKKPKKPELRLTKWWTAMLRKIETRATSRWTELGYILLSVGYEDQRIFERKFLRTQQVVRTHWREEGHQCIVYLTTGPPQRKDVITGYAYKRLRTREERNQRLEKAGDDALKFAGTDRAVVIGVDVDKRDNPYSVIGCVIKKELNAQHLESP